MRGVLDVGHLIRATGNSLRGIRDAFRTGCAFRQEVVLGVLQLVALVFVDERAWVKAALVSLWVILLAMELVNSAVEAVVDLVSPGWNELARNAKDYCSAAVFMVAALLAASWLAVLVHQFGGE